MEDIKKIISAIKNSIQIQIPELSENQKKRMYNIINPDISDYIILGVKISIIEKVVKNAHKTYSPSYESAIEIFKALAKTNVEEYKFAAFFFIDRYRKQLSSETPRLFKTEYFQYCHTWSTCDSCCIRVLGPFLAKKNNTELARITIDDWIQDSLIWIKRASLVLLLKIIIIHKEFDETYVFNKIEQLLSYSNENYIAKGIGWLLKTCTKYKSDIIVKYLIKNQHRLSRLILRYACEKLPKEQQRLIMEK